MSKSTVSVSASTSPTVVLQSEAKAREGVEAETRTLIPEIQRALRKNTAGFRDTVPDIAEQVIRRTR